MSIGDAWFPQTTVPLLCALQALPSHLTKRHLPKLPTPRGPGRPPADRRAVMTGIWYVLWTGCQWKAVHRSWFGVSSSVLHARLQQWQREGRFAAMMTTLVRFYHRRQRIQWTWQSLDARNGAAPLGGEATGKNPTDRAKKGTKLHLLVDGRGAAVAGLKVYAALAMKAGTVAPDHYTRIQTVKGYQDKELRRIDDKRTITRIGAKKAETVLITPEQAAALKQQPTTPQGRRDAVLMAMLIDHGLRCGELALLRIEDIDLERGLFRFLRPKVQKVQTHRLWPDARQALIAYVATDAGKVGPLLMASRKGGQLTHQGMSERAITGRVAELGRTLGIDGLSAHDLRHYWATMRARAGTPPDRLMDAGGWNSLEMPMRYIAAETIANEGVK